MRFEHDRPIMMYVGFEIAVKSGAADMTGR